MSINNFKNLKVAKRNKGFSLIETLVAITILLVAIGGPLTIAHQALVDANIAKNQTEAIFLAQDAVEYVKNVRDKNIIDGNDWLTSLGVCASGCRVDSALNTINSCGGTCPKIKFNESTGLYGYGGGFKETIFIRTVTITPTSADESKVVVSLTWSARNKTNSFQIEDTIFNWSDN